MNGIKPIMFLFMTGAYDILFTTLVVLPGWAEEINPLVNWISPNWLMCLVMAIGNLALCLIAFPVYDRFNDRYPIKTALYSLGAVHIAGAFSGLMAIAIVVMGL
jgi:hypothetical protein